MKYLSIILGVFLTLGGIAYFAFDGFTYRSQEKVLDFGPLQAYAETEKKVPVSPLLGAAVIGGGLVLVLVGLASRKPR